MEQQYTIYLELSNKLNHKFYEIIVTEESVFINYGRIGHTGISKIYVFESLDVAQKFYYLQIKRKLRKGYEPAIKGNRFPRSIFIHPGQLRLFPSYKFD